MDELREVWDVSSRISPSFFESAWSDDHGYALNQSKQATLADGSAWAYEYDKLGQVSSGKRYWSDNAPVAGQHARLIGMMEIDMVNTHLPQMHKSLCKLFLIYFLLCVLAIGNFAEIPDFNITPNSNKVDDVEFHVYFSELPVYHNYFKITRVFITLDTNKNINANVKLGRLNIFNENIYIIALPINSIETENIPAQFKSKHPSNGSSFYFEINSDYIKRSSFSIGFSNKIAVVKLFDWSRATLPN